MSDAAPSARDAAAHARHLLASSDRARLRLVAEQARALLLRGDALAPALAADAAPPLGLSFDALSALSDLEVLELLVSGLSEFLSVLEHAERDA